MMKNEHTRVFVTVKQLKVKQSKMLANNFKLVSTTASSWSVERERERNDVMLCLPN